MRTRPLGTTGLEVSELTLGTWGLSGDAYGEVREAEQDRVIDRALAVGVTCFDTADGYGRGAMESKLGKYVPTDPDFGAVIVTKIGTDRQSVPPRKRFDPAFVRESFDRSQERLNRSPVDCVLLHNPSTDALARGEATGVLTELKTAGRLKSWGVSVGNTDVARAALAQGAEVIELAYNAFFSRDLHDIAGEVTEKGVGVLARSVLGHGLLCGYWAKNRVFPDGDHRTDRWSVDELRMRMRQTTALRALVGGTVYTLRGGALRFVLSNDAVSSAVIGPRSFVQLDQLVREAGKGPPYLTDEAHVKLAARLGDLGVQT